MKNPDFKKVVMDDIVFATLVISSILFENRKSAFGCVFRGIVYSLSSIIIMLTMIGGITFYFQAAFYLRKKGFPANYYEMYRGIIMTLMLLVILFLCKITISVLFRNTVNEKKQYYLLK